MRCEYAHDDGAYVLGALAPAERAAYERHLGTCQTCRDAVAEIAVLPGLLGRLDPATALELLGVDQSDGATGRRPVPAIGGDSGDDARMNVLLEAAAKERRQARRKRSVRFASAMSAAACLALVATLGFNLARGGQLLPDGDPTAPGGGVAAPTQTVPADQVHMTPMKLVSDDVPLKAEIGLKQHPWGTEVTMECEYDGPEDEKQQSWRLHLVAFGPDNEHEQVASWKVAPDKPVEEAKGSTRLAGEDLVRLELRKADGTVLLSYDVH